MDEEGLLRVAKHENLPIVVSLEMIGELLKHVHCSSLTGIYGRKERSLD